ncbi:MAG TPA: DUF885 domain-containing protein [Chloroflexi bacterium]|nr:DUF885 domain-containing protein [Chloroflexota bacterium]
MNNSEAKFYERAEAWLYRLLELNPVAATQLGEHRWDDRLGDSSLEGIESQHREILTAVDEFAAMDPTGFSPDSRIDYILVEQIFKSFVRQHEKGEGYLRDPGSYLGEAMGGVFMLIIKDFAPLPERLRSALGRTDEIPRVLQEGRQNLVLERVPRVWAEVALEQARQAPGLFGFLLPAMAADMPELQQQLGKAGQVATEAIQEYVAFIENDVLPNAEGDFATGKDLFDEMLREEHMVDYDADELIEIGWEQLRLTRELMEETARQIDPNKTVKEMLEEAKADHPTAEGLMAAYQHAMESARQYVIDHEIATIPEGETLRIIETPPYLRPIIPYAAYMPPGILEERQEGLFLVTPVDPAAPAEEQEQKLKGHYSIKLPITALHEAYPGHHLQLVWGNRHERIPRRMGAFLSTLFVEGWAFYCEELMEQLGYIGEPLQRLGRLSDQLWRAARIILDVSLHTRGMDVDQAVDFLVDECQLERTNAIAEVRRYTSSPTQPQSYLMGKLAILELVNEYRRAHPDASLREVHDAILQCGSLPPRLMRQRLLG